MLAFIRYPQANGKFIYVIYDGTQMNCDQADTWFNGLSLAQKKAIVLLAQPDLPAGSDSFKVRDCGGTVTPPDNPQVQAITNNTTDYVENGTDPTTNPPTNQNYDSDGVLGGHFTANN